MNGISTSLPVLLILGLPQGMLATLALHLFTRIRLERKKYALLSLIYISTTYLIRFFPITIGVNTVLSFLVVILSFQVAYQYQLSKVISSVISSVVILILIAVSEELNMLLLILMFGQSRAERLFISNTGWIGSLGGIPTNIFLAMFILFGHRILKILEKRKLEHGTVGKSAGE